jgi:4-amino-4-deoxy-L-arabinose transferase-like glycosyltransferase
MKTKKRNILLWLQKKQVFLELLFVFSLGIYMTIWSISKPFNYAPDEEMRYAVPLYIYRHGKLPLGSDPIIRNKLFGFSYAFMPTWLEPLLASFFMHIVAFVFGESEFKLVVAARFVSVLSISGMTFCLARTLNRLFENRIKWLTLVIICLIPQVTFLGSYVNQDSVNLLGAAIILLAWVQGLQDGWNVKNSVLLAIGISIVALSYYFGYGWILLSIIFFFLSYIVRLGKNIDFSKMWKLTGLICLIVIGITAFFFARNLILYHGDLLGRTSMANGQKLYAVDALKPQNRPSLRMQGKSVTYLLHDNSWWLNSFISFIGFFGYLKYPVAEWIWSGYAYLFTFVLIMCLLSVVFVIRQRNKKKVFFGCFVGAAFLLPIFLSYWYSYSTDYGPQGRYVMSLLPALTLITANGIKTAEEHKGLKCLVIAGMVIYVALYAFLNVYLPS